MDLLTWSASVLNLTHQGVTQVPEPDSFILPDNVTEPLSNSTSWVTGLPPLDIFYITSEILVAIISIIGNALTIAVFTVDQKLHRLTNYYIVSLALADLLVGLVGIPFAILTSVGLPRPLWACLLMLSTLLTLCVISVFCLVAVSVDRYWAILHPISYIRILNVKITKRIILACWVSGTLVGLMPMMGWHEEYDDHCIFTQVMSYSYLIFLAFNTIFVPGPIMIICYARIYNVILKQKKSKSAVSEQKASSREVKAAKSMSIIVLFFMVSWLPINIINCIQAICRNCPVPMLLLYFSIILSHANSALNPFLYAYSMQDFNKSLKKLVWHRLLRQSTELNFESQSQPSDACQLDSKHTEELPPSTLIKPKLTVLYCGDQ
ncbi:adenosine receptor A1 [Procambarus clarkii]|uniref:adenosine receptor A1 n=1 Tax=Procambarus clarkii TaxID=6728 RepID=UPI001E676937|nr:adenosine receptor A1-like [Procambarus clarkii]XP_045606767.1 adenosine receptor A1-like [Procambarus clarkii]